MPKKRIKPQARVKPVIDIPVQRVTVRPEYPSIVATLVEPSLRIKLQAVAQSLIDRGVGSACTFGAPGPDANTVMALIKATE